LIAQCFRLWYESLLPKEAPSEETAKKFIEETKTTIIVITHEQDITEYAKGKSRWRSA